jgi:hypothetical protein
MKGDDNFARGQVKSPIPFMFPWITIAHGGSGQGARGREGRLGLGLASRAARGGATREEGEKYPLNWEGDFTSLASAPTRNAHNH